MKPEDVKRVLIACRSGTTDEDDPVVRGALALAARDPQLAAWWREQQLVQAALGGQFRALPVPPALREEILASRKLIRVEWWRHTAVRVVAMAAVLVGLLSAVFMRRPAAEPDMFADFRERMVRTVIREYRMDVTTSAEPEIRDFLRAQQGHPDFQLPAPLRMVPLFGVGRLTWRGQTVSMICFERQPKVLMYLFVIDRRAFPEAPESRPVFEEVVRRATASWSDGDQVYVLASEAPSADLQTLFP